MEFIRVGVEEFIKNCLPSINYDVIQRRQGQRKNKRNTENVIENFFTFDIETSTFYDDLGEPHSFMYTWRFCTGRYTVRGSYWGEFFRLIHSIRNYVRNVVNEPVAVCYVHNLPFEFQFLSGLIDFQNTDVFSKRNRKVLKCRAFNFMEFRCSYALTNRSLESFLEMFHVKQKLDGDLYDYKKIRFPWTKLSGYEDEYACVDVEGLYEAMVKKLKAENDDLNTVPMTSTSYVRREVQRAIGPIYNYIHSLNPRKPDYIMLRDCMRGGNTHSNRYIVGDILENVASFDMSSAYPGVQMLRDYPIEPFKSVQFKDMKTICRLIGKGLAVIGSYVFENIRLKKGIYCPYLSLSKTKSIYAKVDNGRILEAKTVITELTELDFEIVLKQYDFDSIGCIEAFYAKKGPLPRLYTDTIFDMYKRKCELKIAIKNSDDDALLYEYNRYKELINAIYGMSAQNPVRELILYNNYKFISKDEADKIGLEYKQDSIEMQLLKAKFPYQWGVYTTSWTRYELQEFIDIVGDDFVYCDTDSVKFMNYEKYKDAIEKLNAEKIKRCEERGRVVHVGDSVFYPSVFEKEKSYIKFITQGAKRYAFEKLNKKSELELDITVAGVSKKINKQTQKKVAVEELLTIENFKEGMIWRAAGGLQAVYNDDDNFWWNGVHVTKNVSLEPSTYEMTFTKDFRKLVDECKLYSEGRRFHETV